MAKPSQASITIRRDAQGAFGFDCRCGHSYAIPKGVTGDHAGHLLDAMVRYHEAKHKAGKIR